MMFLYVFFFDCKLRNLRSFLCIPGTSFASVVPNKTETFASLCFRVCETARPKEKPVRQLLSSAGVETTELQLAVALN